MRKSPIYTLNCERYTFQFRRLYIGDPVRLSAMIDSLPLPYKLYLPAYDAFKVCCFGLGAVADKIKAGIVLQVGMVILDQSKFMNPIEKVQEDLEGARNGLMGFFDQVRNMAMLYFNYDLDDSAEWTYDNLMEMAARVEQATGLDLSVVPKQVEEQPVQQPTRHAPQPQRRPSIDDEVISRLKVEPGDMVIRKGDIVSSDKMSYHNVAKSTK